MQFYDTPIRLGISTAWITKIMRWIYKGAYPAASNFIVTAFFVTISIPVGTLLYFAVVYLKKRLIKACDTNVSINPANCEKLWYRQVKLSEVVTQIKDIPNIPLEKVPWHVSLFLKQLIVAVRAIVNYQAALEQKFQHLDSSYSPLPQGMKVVTMEDLCKSRVRGYEYLV